MTVPQTIGSRAQVMHGNAKKTSGGLTKSQLKYNKQGKIVSKKASALAKKNNRLVKAGYIARKGQFGVEMKGGANDILSEKKSSEKNPSFVSKIFIREDRQTDTNNEFSNKVIDSKKQQQFLNEMKILLKAKYIDYDNFTININNYNNGIINEGATAKVSALLTKNRRDPVAVKEYLRKENDTKLNKDKVMNISVRITSLLGRFYYEIQWSKLTYEYITKIYGWTINEDNLQIIMERGKPFSHYLSNIQTESISNIKYDLPILRYLLCISKGLLYLHNNNYIHQDIKENNILIFGETAKITDFGCMVDENNIDPLYIRDLPQEGTVAYTDPLKVYYMLPGSTVNYINKLDDIYSFGITLLSSMNYDFKEQYMEQVYNTFTKFSATKNISFNARNDFMKLYDILIGHIVSCDEITPSIKDLLLECVCKKEFRITADKLVKRMEDIVDMVGNYTLKKLVGFKSKDYMIFTAMYENELEEYYFRFSDVVDVIGTVKNPNSLLGRGYNWSARSYKSKREKNCNVSECTILKKQLNKLDLITRIALKEKIMSVSSKYKEGTDNSPYFPIKDDLLS